MSIRSKLKPSARWVFDMLGYEVHRKDELAFDRETESTIDAVQKFTMTSRERIAAACQAARYIAHYDIQGAVVECGVWRGGSMMAIARTLLEVGDTSRDLYLFDTFEGMPQPGTFDRRPDGRSADALRAQHIEQTGKAWCEASLDDVRQNLATIGYPEDRLNFIEGMVEDTIPGAAPDRIALLRLDTDWYESTRHELEHLAGRLTRNGVLIVDDYGHWEGARRAVDEWTASLTQPVLLSRIDYTGRMAVLAMPES